MLIILTSAVVITGVGVPRQAQLATFYSNIDTVQDLVTLTMGNNMIEAAQNGYGDNYKWAGIANNYVNENTTVEFTQMIGALDGVELTKVSSDLLDNTTLEDGEKDKYYVDNKGTVYYEGFEYNGATYYNKNTSIQIPQLGQTKYTVKYNANNGTGTMADSEYTYGETKALTANEFTAPEGNVFKGWAITPTGEVVYTNGQEVSNLTSEVNGIVMLYAVWGEETYEITFNLNGGTGTMAAVQTVSGTYELPQLANTVTAPIGMKFQGWSTAANKPVITEYNVTGATEFVARWQSEYIGCYVDVDQDGIVDGVIYADRVTGGSGEWGTSNTKTYTVDTIASGEAKTYTKGANYTGANAKFGENPVVTVSGNTTGEERFYVMALSDAASDYYYWYYSARTDGINDYNTVTQLGIGAGKDNTSNMLAKWVAGTPYGAPKNSTNTPSGTKDMWDLLPTEEGDATKITYWYIPSQLEWVAFADAFNITATNSSMYGLSDVYWSSSLDTNSTTWRASFTNGYMIRSIFNGNRFVRFGATF